MRASELELTELIDFVDGEINLQGRRLVLHSVNAFAHFRKDLAHMLGPEHTRRILTRFGYIWGEVDAAAMQRLFSWDSPEEMLKAGPKLHAIQGVSQVEIVSMDIDDSTGAMSMEVIWPNSNESDEHLLEFEQSDEAVCWSLVGYASGYASRCLGRKIFFVETECRGKGDKVCRAIGKDERSWGDEINKWLKYFESYDIHGKVQKLTEELGRKTVELANLRANYMLTSHKPSNLFADIHSQSFRNVMDMAERIAPFDSSVLLLGETGVGKEIVAQYIHNLSKRAEGPFVAINCGALPETLLESELFGHTKGSFTGAIHDKIGLFEHANKGTVFLDEIGDVSPAMQMKLLRVLQEKEILRIGENKPRKINIRIIAATNRNIEEEIKKENFREDLYYRLGVIEINIPPLRSRTEDIGALARYFVKTFSNKLDIRNLRLDAKTIDRLLEYDWPGNVRELENVIERSAILCKDGLIQPECLPKKVLSATDKARKTAVVGEKMHGMLFEEEMTLLIDKCLHTFNKKYGKNIAGLAQEVKDHLVKYYALNDRDVIEAFIEDAYQRCGEDEITMDHVSLDQLKMAESDAQQTASPVKDAISQTEISLIIDSLRRNDGNISNAALDLDMHRATLWRKMKKYGIDNKNL